MLITFFAIVLQIKYSQQNCMNIYNGSPAARYCKYPYSFATHIFSITLFSIRLRKTSHLSFRYRPRPQLRPRMGKKQMKSLVSLAMKKTALLTLQVVTPVIWIQENPLRTKDNTLIIVQRKVLFWGLKSQPHYMPLNK